MRALLKDYLPERPPGREDLGWLLLPVLIAAVLLAFDRFGVEKRFAEIFADQLAAGNYNANTIRFYAQIWLSGACLVLMVLLPTIYLWVFGARGGWALALPNQEVKYLRIYLLLLVVMLPLLWLAAGQERFNNFYPLYNPVDMRGWLIFEAVYLTQFFCVEFFFRGPLLFRLHHRFGLAAVGMMTVPYALIHTYKPFPEALGSIVAGLLLGYLALKIRSIWPGVALHCAVALSMDVFALLRSGRLEQLLH